MSDGAAEEAQTLGEAESERAQAPSHDVAFPAVGAGRVRRRPSTRAARRPSGISVRVEADRKTYRRSPLTIVAHGSGHVSSRRSRSTSNPSSHACPPDGSSLIAQDAPVPTSS
jgi:hypothetical protein